MNKSKRLLCFALAVLMLIPSVACADNSESKDKNDSGSVSVTTAPTQNDDVNYEPDELPELDFGGEKVTLLTSDSEEGTLSFHETSLTVEDLNSNVLNDSIYNRELYVEERLGVEIYNAKSDELTNEIEKNYMSGEGLYDAYIGDNAELSKYVFYDHLLDLRTVDYLDLDKPWWSQNFNEQAEIFGKLYITTGSLCLSLLKNTYAVYYNKDLAEDYENSKPELANLYDTVYNGKWTFDLFLEIGGELYEDINGNSIRDLEDIYGIAYDRYFPIDAMWSGFDITVFSRTSDGWFEFDVNTDKMYTALDKLYVMLNEMVGSITANVGTDVDSSYSCDRPEVYFANGTNLFLVERLGFAEKDTMRNMQDDYGVLPYPKYDENQKEYLSFSHDFYGAVVIPNTNTKPEVVGAVLEAMASYSYRDTVPAYLDTVLKGQYMSDPESRQMIDIVVDGIMIDAAWIYIHTLASDYPRQYRYYIANGERSYATQHEIYSKKAKQTLKIYKREMQE